MITKMFSVYDGKARMFQVPFFMPTIGMALRAFEDLSNDSNTLVCRHPADFSLYEIGEYNDEDGRCESYSPLRLVGTALEYKKSDKQLNFDNVIEAVKSSGNGKVTKEVVTKEAS